MIPSKNFRTDIALEIAESLFDESGQEIPGVEMITEQDEQMGITVTWVKVTSQAGEAAMGRPMGNYVTLESQSMKENDPAVHEEITKILSRKLGKLHNLTENSSILVIGLGNRYVTPDALGPQVCDKLLVTRHLQGETPIEVSGQLRCVSAIAPGVMGITGIETAETVKGIAERISPDLIIAIDALASRKTSRVNATIQISDTGVSPGAGMGNKRTPLNEETVGVPVIAIGVPTVVDAATLVNDTIERLLGAMSNAVMDIPEGANIFGMMDSLQEDERYALIRELLDPYTGNMFVTPKEVDAVITRLAGIIAGCLNIALHPGITQADVNRYLN